jgi:hypothetical protein
MAKTSPIGQSKNYKSSAAKKRKKTESRHAMARDDLVVK